MDNDKSLNIWEFLSSPQVAAEENFSSQFIKQFK